METKNILSEYFDEDIVKLASNHHERLNGSGYPNHFKAEKLNLKDRILQVSDVTSALLLSRSYKEAFEAERCISILEKLVKDGELCKRCVEEIERIFLTSLTEQPQ